MKRPAPADARTLALAVLGQDGEHLLERLEAAGLTVVRRADLRPADAPPRQLGDVELIIPEDWQEPHQVTVAHGPRIGGELIVLHALRSAVPAIREAHALHRIMGHRLDVLIDETEGLLVSVVAVER